MTNLSNDWIKSGAGITWELDTAVVGDIFFGVFLNTEENVGPNSSKLHNFIRYKDEMFKERMGEWSIWGTTLLDSRFKNYVHGEQVAIVYLGKKASEKRKGSSYHDFEVHHLPPEKKRKIDETSGNDLSNDWVAESSVDDALNYLSS